MYFFLQMSGFDPTNPAFRPPGLPGYPPPSSHPGVCRDPFCRDPSCPTAAYSAYLARISGAASLPPGYLELLEAFIPRPRHRRPPLRREWAVRRLPVPIYAIG